VGHDPAASTDQVSVAMGRGVVSVPRLILNQLIVLGQHWIGFSVLSHALLPAAGVDGLLVLCFLRGQILNVDFRAGLITLIYADRDDREIAAAASWWDNHCPALWSDSHCPCQ
jgi:hypothetical protein